MWLVDSVYEKVCFSIFQHKTREEVSGKWSISVDYLVTRFWLLCVETIELS